MAGEQKKKEILSQADLRELIESIDKKTGNFNEEAKLEDSKDKETLFKKAKESYNLVDDQLIKFIEAFVSNHNSSMKLKIRLKEIFFGLTMMIFVIVIATPIVFLFIALVFGCEQYLFMFGTVCASIIEVLTTIIVLPKIVAEYLFNKQEEKENIQIVDLMKDYSKTIHGYDKED